MRRAAQANWSRLPNHNPRRFYTAWVIRVGFVMPAVRPVYPRLCCKTRSFLSAIVGLEFGVSAYPAFPLRELRHRGVGSFG
jgi:hypothetical protein